MNSTGAKPILWRILSPLAWPFVLLYALAVRLKNAGYDLGLLKIHRLSSPVVSVGNLSLGGAGKTPMVLLLARLLEARGWSVDVLSRGYGRRDRRVLRVDPNTTEENAADRFGDEPLLMARRGVSVTVGADRYQAGLLAERNTRAANQRSLHILDDGFQHRRLARAVDILLLRRADLDDDMLPSGRLREPLCVLERADICVLRAEDADLRSRVLQLMRQNDSERVWIVERRTTVSSTASPAVAFCAIGDPDVFFRGLRQAGIELRNTIAFRDHHSYTRKDIERLKHAAVSSGAVCFVTTEKDSARLKNSIRTDLETAAPVVVAGLEMVLRQETGSVEMLESLLSRPLQLRTPDVR